MSRSVAPYSEILATPLLVVVLVAWLPNANRVSSLEEAHGEEAARSDRSNCRGTQFEMSQETRQELRRFADTTSMKGVKRVLNAQGMIVRAFWMAALLICCAMLLFHFITIVMSYCSFTAIRNSNDALTTPNFPHITICNLFPVLDTKKYLEDFDRYLDRVESIRSQAPERVLSNTELWDYFSLISTFNANADLLRELNGNSTALDSFVVECQEYGWDLFEVSSCKQVALSLTRPLQLCKTIKPRWDAGAVKFILFIDNVFPRPVDGYFSWIRAALSAGVKVIVHPSGRNPEPENAIYVSPGMDLTIEVAQHNVTRLPKPYLTNCTERQRISSDEKDDFGSIPYSQEMCISICRQRQFIEACGCLDPIEYITMKELDAGNTSFCPNITFFLEQSPEFVSGGRLTEKYWKLVDCAYSFAPTEDRCDCPMPCHETTYERSSSGAKWPNIYYQLAFYKKYIRNDKRYAEKFTAYEAILKDNISHDETIRQLENLKLIKQTFIQVTVKMNRKRVEMITYIPAMSWDSLASGLGGSLNLWIGISVLTAAEVIELLYSLMQISLRSRTDEQSS